MHRSRFTFAGAFLLTIAVALSACAAGDTGGGAGETEAREATARPLSESAQTLVDSANLAYRGGEFQAALSHFTSALEEAPGHPVPLFGVFLASTALGDSTLADSVATILREEAPWLLEMMQHSEGQATTDPHAGMGMAAAPHAGMVMVPVPDSEADTTR